MKTCKKRVNRARASKLEANNAESEVEVKKESCLLESALNQQLPKREERLKFMFLAIPQVTW